MDTNASGFIGVAKNANITHKNKCGEIFIHENDLFSFLCVLCGNQNSFDLIENFLLHIKDNHCESKKFFIEKYQEHNDQHNNNQEINYNIGNYSSQSYTEDIETIISNKTLLDEKANSNENDEWMVADNKTETIKALELNQFELKIDESDEIIQDQSYNQDQVESRKSKRNSNISGKNKPVCNICGKQLSSLRSLNRHKENVKCAEKINRSLTCDLCGKTFASYRKLRQHKLYTESGHDPEKLLELRKTFKKGKLLKNDLRCTYCNKFCASIRLRLEHERIHTGERPFECQVCGKKFYTKHDLVTHTKLHQPIENFYQCDVCGLKFKNQAILSSHQQRHGEKTIKCSYCDKLFYTKGDKIIHERTHTGEKPYKCDFCDQSFTTSSSLKSHRYRHLGLKNHKCDQCDGHFYSKDLLNEHIAIHHNTERPFVCQICNSSFKINKHLKIHMRIHSDIRKYVCNICSKGFKQRTGLYIHMRTHGLNQPKSNQNAVETILSI